MRRVTCLILSVLLAFLLSAYAEAEGHRTSITQDGVEIPIVVVSGTPFEMGKSLGELTKEDAESLLSRFMDSCRIQEPEMYANEKLDAAWEALSPHTDKRFIEEMKGFSEGSGIPFRDLCRSFAVPAVTPFSCSSVAAWGKATANGHLYQTRNLDWTMELRPHDFPCIVVYLPKEGFPHVNVTFAGYLGCYTGININGIALASMGDAPSSEYPYNLEGEYCCTFFRRILYDASDLDQAIDIVKSSKRIKKYHYVISDGKNMKAAVKIKDHAPDLVIWNDNDPADEFAPDVKEDIVYNDEGRGVFPLLEKKYGEITHQDMIDFACSIPIKGANIYNVVFDAATLEMWFSYAKGDVEAYKREFMYIDLKEYLK